MGQETENTADIRGPLELWVTPHHSKIRRCLLRERDTCHTHHQVRDSGPQLLMLGREEWQGSLAIACCESLSQGTGTNAIHGSN